MWKDAAKSCPGERAPTNLGIELFKMGKFDMAFSELKKAANINKSYPIPHAYIGDIYTEKGLLDKAYAEYTTAWKLIKKAEKEGNVEFKISSKFKGYIKNSMGILFMNKGNTVKAIKEFIEATKLDPDNYSAYNNLGLAYMENNQINKAIAAFKNALFVNDRNPEIYLNLGEAYYKKGFIDNAIKAYRKAIEINPNYEDAIRRLKLISINKSTTPPFLP